MENSLAVIAKNAGAEAPFTRPESLSDDVTPLAGVLEHAISWYNSTHPVPCESAGLFLATALPIQAEHIRNSYDTEEDWITAEKMFASTQGR